MLKCKHNVQCDWKGQKMRCTFFDSEYFDCWEIHAIICPVAQNFEKHEIDIDIPDPYSDKPLHATMWRLK